MRQWEVQCRLRFAKSWGFDHCLPQLEYCLQSGTVASSCGEFLVAASFFDEGTGLGFVLYSERDPVEVAVGDGMAWFGGKRPVS